jgi:hypothetical protein
MCRCVQDGIRQRELSLKKSLGNVYYFRLPAALLKKLFPYEKKHNYILSLFL